jgi:hypothetical protein
MGKKPLHPVPPVTHAREATYTVCKNMTTHQIHACLNNTHLTGGNKNTITHLPLIVFSCVDLHPNQHYETQHILLLHLQTSAELPTLNPTLASFPPFIRPGLYHQLCFWERVVTHACLVKHPHLPLPNNLCVSRSLLHRNSRGID